MKILVINSGSSTLKFDLISAGDGGQGTVRLAHGVVERIGGESSMEFHASTGETFSKEEAVPDHHAAIDRALVWLRLLPVGEGIEAVGHRVVHGGSRFTAPTLVDDEALLALEELSDLAPLHNPPALEGVRSVKAALGPGVPVVAVFDTAFHSSLPPHAYTYALPHELAERHSIRRYGFHGIAHEYMLKRYSKLAGVAPNQATIITLQLGNGCSAAAIGNGRSIDTSMGFTPLEGLVMGTRSGDLDPQIVGYLAHKEGVPVDAVEEWLNKRSGLLGVSGRSGDMRDLLSVMEQDSRAKLAIEVFCYRVRKYVGAYLAALGGAQAIIFGGGIGEHAPGIRARILAGMEWCGLQLDEKRNAATTGSEGLISADGSRIAVYVVAVDESVVIAERTVECVVSC